MSTPAVNAASSGPIAAPRLRPSHSSLAPLWDRREVGRLLTERLAAFQTGLLEFRSVERGALRFRNGWLEATYQLEVQGTIEPERRIGSRRFAWVLLDPANWHHAAEAEYLLSPTDPILPETILDDPATLEFLSRLASMEEGLLTAASREIVNHRFGSRLVWRLSPRRDDGMGGAADAPQNLAVRISRRKPPLVRLAPPSGREVVAEPLLPLGMMEAGRACLSVATWLDGPSLHSRLRAAEASIPFPEIGAAIASFHRLARSESERPARSLAGEIAQLKDLLKPAGEIMEGLEETLAPAIERLEEDAASAAGSEAVLIHGDLHDKQILFEGRKVRLIDMDAAAPGDPALDLGNLAAHVLLRTLQWGRDPDAARRFNRLLTGGYRAAGGKADPRAVDLYTRVALIRLALIYLFRPDAAPLFPQLLAAQDQIGEA